jgi:hypothetical protein
MLVTAAFLGTFFVIFSLHINGYCFSKHRFVTKSEMIITAIESELSMLSQSHFFEDETLKQNELTSHFSNAQDFQQRNPDCCALVGNSENYNIYGFYPLVFGQIANSVALKYQFEFKNSNGVLDSRSHLQEIPISSCARIEVEVYRSPIGRPFL